VDHAELPRWLAGADAFVLPSFTEGHPKALIEAMASGLPCIASDCPGNRSLIRDGETGLLFDPSSAAALARALERALGDPALGRALGRRARTLVCEEYDLRRLVAAEIDLLKRAARTPGG
jgi:glycosyltransferase involved in cell wall biosynthesis